MSLTATFFWFQDQLNVSGYITRLSGWPCLLANGLKHMQKTSSMAALYTVGLLMENITIHSAVPSQKSENSSAGSSRPLLQNVLRSPCLYGESVNIPHAFSNARLYPAPYKSAFISSFGVATMHSTRNRACAAKLFERTACSLPVTANHLVPVSSKNNWHSSKTFLLFCRIDPRHESGNHSGSGHAFCGRIF